MKIGRFLLAVLFLCLFATGVQAYTWDDLIIENTYGAGDNTALLVVDFTDDGNADDAFAWAVNFDGETIANAAILEIVDTNDADFSVEWNSSFVNAITYGAYSGPHDPTWTNYWWSNNSSDLGETWDGYAGGTGDQGTVGWVYSSPTGSGEPATPAVPVPAAILLFGSGVLGLVGIRRKSTA